MKFNRSAGILLHITSLPSPEGMGDLGPGAYQWVKTLSKMGCGLWQVLPLGPTGYGDSPYQSFSTFAGNPYLISPHQLVEEGLLSQDDFAMRPIFIEEMIDYGTAISWKLFLLEKAFENFTKRPLLDLSGDFEEFRSRNSTWLVDYSFFMAIKEKFGGISWNKWPKSLRMHDELTISRFAGRYSATIRKHAFYQFLFYRQWHALHRFAHTLRIRIIGDLPIFVSFDSADVWANREMFLVDKNGKPKYVSGVPPDYFSPTGQLWGNPIYHWDVHRDTGFAWWIRRVQAIREQVDVIRLDHFRGFTAYWQVPAGLPTAEIGEWISSPGEDLFNAIETNLGKSLFIAEDLGLISADVFSLRDKLGFPGMKILQFAFNGESNNLFLPHHYPVNCVAYTGTHDNDTCIGWYQTASEKERSFCQRYLAHSCEGIAWDMIRAIWISPAVFSLAPLQDFLGLDSRARMNFPGKPSGNWVWRMKVESIQPELIVRIRELNDLYSRMNN